MRRLLSPGDVADQLGVTVRTVQRLIDGRKLESVKVGRLNRVPERALDEYIEANTRTRKEVRRGKG